MPPGPFYAVHPGFPVRPELMHMKRESPEKEKHSDEPGAPPPPRGRFPPPGLLPVSGEEGLNYVPMVVEAHPPGPPITLTNNMHRINDPVSYHPVRRRGEAAAMVDIGHGMFSGSFSYFFSVSTIYQVDVGGLVAKLRPLSFKPAESDHNNCHLCLSEALVSSLSQFNLELKASQI